MPSDAVGPPSTSGPKSISELIAVAEVAWRNVLVAESQALQADGCCSADVWRGHLCSYHQGFADGIDAVIDRAHAIGLITGRVAGS